MSKGNFPKSVSFGEHTVIEENVIIGENVTIGNYVVIKEGTVIDNNVTIGDMVVLGKRPSSNKTMARKPKTDLSPLYIGESSTISSGCVLYRGSTLGKGTFVGDLSSIREKVEIGEHSIIGRNVMVENNTKIGSRVTIQTGSYITADMIIEDDVFIGPCISTSNDKYMGEGNYKHAGPIIKKGAKIGNNATLLPGIIIDEMAVIGAGAVVVKDVGKNETFVGNPARPIKKKIENE